MDILTDREWISYRDSILKDMDYDTQNEQGFTNSDEYVLKLIWDSISKKRDVRIVIKDISHESFDKRKMERIFNAIFTEEYCESPTKKEFEDLILGKLSKEYIDEHYFIEDNIIKYIDVDDPKIGSIENYSTPEKDDIRDELINSINKSIPNKNIRYLGLEGPSFKSYLKIKNHCELNNINLESIIAEKDERSFNLMESLQNNLELSKSTKTMQLVKRDLDDLIISRFLTSNKIVVDKRKEDIENWVSGNYIQFKMENENYDSNVKIEVDTYTKIVDDIYSEKSDDDILSELDLDKFRSTKMEGRNATSIDEKEGKNIIEYIKNHTNDTHEIFNNAKFNVMNLDYNGPATPKRKYAIKTLFDNYADDQSILYVNFNADRYNKSGVFQEYRDHVIESLDEIIGSDFKITNLFNKNDLSYTSGSQGNTNMEGMIYFVEKI